MRARRDLQRGGWHSREREAGREEDDDGAAGQQRVAQRRGERACEEGREIVGDLRGRSSRLSGIEIEREIEDEGTSMRIGREAIGGLRAITGACGAPSVVSPAR